MPRRTKAKTAAKKSPAPKKRTRKEDVAAVKRVAVKVAAELGGTVVDPAPVSHGIIHKSKTYAAPKGVADAFQEWKDGAALAPLAIKLGFTLYQNLRHHFIKLAGGKEAFYKLREGGAGGKDNRAVGVPGQRPVAAIAAQDDSKVPIIKSCKRSDGWKSRDVFAPTVVHVEGVGNVDARERQYTIHTAPDGTEYVNAKAREKADLRVENLWMNPNVPTYTRLRKFATSSVVKAAEDALTAAARGAEAKEAKKQAAKDKKAAVAKAAA